MTYLERISRSPLTAKAKRRAAIDAVRLFDRWYSWAVRTDGVERESPAWTNDDRRAFRNRVRKRRLRNGRKMKRMNYGMHPSWSNR